jgi:hypothetical protein
MDNLVYVGNLHLRRNTEYLLGIAVQSSFGYLFCVLRYELIQYEDILRGALSPSPSYGDGNRPLIAD